MAKKLYIGSIQLKGAAGKFEGFNHKYIRSYVERRRIVQSVSYSTGTESRLEFVDNDPIW